ncbi:MAG: transketolase [Nanoarchaeota archaeon]|nr:transketolase [Nanoarchaeota archaeon]MBU1028061.1 transketolase [Nanoarchaeota archaeon]
MMQENIIKELEKKAHELKQSTLNLCIGACTGHVTSSMSCAEILAVLYYGNILRQKPGNPKWDGRDRFILSKGQGSPILYVTLADKGFFPKEWLNDFCKENAKFGVHLQCDVPGVEITTGSLGHGLGVGAGMALAAKMDRKDHFVFVLLGDAELYEGSNWEAAMFAGHNRLNNLIAIIDRNWLGVIEYTERALSLEPLEDKWRSFGWEVKRVNGNSVKELLNALYDFRSFRFTKPLVIIADTIKGKGICSMEHFPLMHGAAPRGEAAEKAKQELSECFF